MNDGNEIISLRQSFPMVPAALIERRGLSPYPEAKNLVCAEIGKDGREHRLISEAAAAWQQLRPAAQNEGIELYIVSAYRLLKFRCLQFIPGRQGYFPKNNTKAIWYGK